MCQLIHQFIVIKHLFSTSHMPDLLLGGQHTQCLLKAKMMFIFQGFLFESSQRFIPS